MILFFYSYLWYIMRLDKYVETIHVYQDTPLSMLRLKRKCIHTVAVTQTQCLPSCYLKTLIFQTACFWIGKILLCKSLPSMCSLAFIKCTSNTHLHLLSIIRQPSRSVKTFSGRSFFFFKNKWSNTWFHKWTRQKSIAKRHQTCTVRVSLAVGHSCA